MSRNRLFTLVATWIAVSLIAFAHLGFFTRYLTDDFCWASKALQYGVIGSAAQWYNTWAGQYTNWLIKGVVGQLSPAFAMILPPLILVGWASAAIFTLYRFGKLLRIRQAVGTASVLGLALTYAIFSGAPDVIQSLYWMSATIPYTLPLVILTFYVGFFLWVLRRYPAGKLPAWVFIFTAGVTFVAGGTSESYVLFQGAVLVLMMLSVLAIAPAARKRGGLRLLIVGLIFSGLAFAVTLAAPGNAIRQASFGETLPVSEIILRTLRVTASFFATDIGVFSPIPLLIALLLPMLMVSQFATFERPLTMTPRRARGLMGLSLGIALALVLVVIGPPIYATSVAPAPRVYLAAHLVMICTAAFWGCVIGIGLKRPGLTPESPPTLGVMLLLASLLIVGPLLTTGQTLSHVSAFSTFAAEWDQRDHDIRAAAAQHIADVVVPAFSVDLATRARLDTIGDDSSGWVNVCAANYYGVKSITVQDE